MHSLQSKLLGCVEERWSEHNKCARLKGVLWIVSVHTLVYQDGCDQKFGMCFRSLGKLFNAHCGWYPWLPGVTVSVMGSILGWRSSANQAGCFVLTGVLLLESYTLISWLTLLMVVKKQNTLPFFKWGMIQASVPLMSHQSILDSHLSSYCWGQLFSLNVEISSSNHVWTNAARNYAAARVWSNPNWASVITWPMIEFHLIAVSMKQLITLFIIWKCLMNKE